MKMAQHFLLSAKARTLSLKAIYQDGEEAAYLKFCELRWPETNGEPNCPECGCLDIYRITTRRKFKCAACYRQFSVTSGTILASRKMSFTDLLAAICILANAAKGVSALQLSRDLDCQHKTAFVLAHKIREALAAETKGMKLKGEIEVDGAYFGGHVRPANLAEDRVDRRLSENQSGKRRVVIAARARKGRTLTFVAEHESAGVAFLNSVADPWASIHADEASHWDVLHKHYPVSRINHSEAYCLGGACTNAAESYFSRLRRMIQGQHHFVSPAHLHAYAADAAWKEDHRRLDNGKLAYRKLALMLAHPVSREWKGYWQR
jgi:transposase-like protein